MIGTFLVAKALCI